MNALRPLLGFVVAQLGLTRIDLALYGGLQALGWPRDPIGGDMVGIGFLTQPGRVASDVRLFWTRNGRLQTLLQGRPVAQGNDADRWLCELGVLKDGDTVEYWMVATGDEQRAETERYRFGVRRQRRLAGISASAQHAYGWCSPPAPTMVRTGRRCCWR
jgi:hypothetical protein